MNLKAFDIKIRILYIPVYKYLTLYRESIAMRINLPVTNNEYELDSERSIVSKTDLAGNITYVNPYFCEVSGYSPDELLGSPQNILRHPDMPSEAFADMWQTLKSGLPWTGLVKNRCKNGDYYWVKANATPIRENGKVVGYMSVRTKPARAVIEATAPIYQKFIDNQAQGLKVYRGEVVSTGLTGAITRLRTTSLSTRVHVSAALIILFAAIAYALPNLLGSQSQTWPLAATLMAVAIAIQLWIYLIHQVAQPLTQATHIARAIAGGDLTVKFHSTRHDDAGLLLQALEQMNVNLVSIIGDVRSNVATINSGAHEIAAGNMDLSSRTESQASSLEETAASMEQFASTVKGNASNAQQASKLAEAASVVAVKGGEMVSQVGHTMDGISTSAHKISDIIGLINGIAFQTNILALNAAVEAARAGEQGRGFAVVATEVRTLAQRSAAAAKEIKVLIDESASKVDEGNKLVADTKATVAEIVDSVQKVAQIIREISTASREQGIGVDQVNHAINEMDRITQQNSALVEEAAVAAANLSEQANELALAVSVFKFDRRLIVKQPKPVPKRQSPQSRALPLAAPALRLKH